VNHRSAPQISAWSAAADENFRALLQQLGPKALGAAEKHMELCEADAARGYGRTWKRIAGMLARMAPGAVESVGQHTLKFHIPDGKYRQQVFALNDSGLGTIDLYMPHIAALAIEQKLLSKPTDPTQVYGIVGEKQSIELSTVTSNDADCPPFCKPMLGWGRKALKVTISAVPNEEQLAIVERLCECAMSTWAAQTAPAK
jgi:hypothetical protein